MNILLRCFNKLKNKEFINRSTPCYICLDDNDGKHIILKCKHGVHANCLETQVRHIKTVGQIPAKFGQCGICSTWIQTKKLTHDLHSDVKELRRYYELWGKGKHSRVYRCYICANLFHEKKPRCADDIQEATPSTIRCMKCVNLCDKHGDEYLVYKCRFCCKIATYHCGNGNHMCNECHEIQTPKPCIGILGGCIGDHITNGEGSQCYGCAMCTSNSISIPTPTSHAVSNPYPSKILSSHELSPDDTMYIKIIPYIRF